MFDFAGNRWYFLSVSIVAVAIALIILAIPPRLVLGIEFSSGSSFTIDFNPDPVTPTPTATSTPMPTPDGSVTETVSPTVTVSPTATATPSPTATAVPPVSGTPEDVSPQALRDLLAELGHPEARVQEVGQNEFLIRTDELEGSPSLDSGEQGPVPSGELAAIEDAIRARFGDFERRDFATVSGSVSSEIALYSFLAVIASAVAIFFYLALAFRRVPSPFRYGACAVLALIHDAIIVLGAFSLMGKIGGSEVDTAFITALLTVIGFSVHDTIVVFDRVRETLSHDPYIPIEEAVNSSMTETLPRSLNTSITLALTVAALLLIGGDTIRDFLLVLLVGVVAGVYSSIGVAAQVLVAWERSDIPRAWHRLMGRRQGTEGVEEPAR